MSSLIDEIENKKSQKFTIGRWTRSSGRVVEDSRTERKRLSENVHASASYGDLVKIYRRFLDLRNEESGDLADAVSYGLRLFDPVKSKDSTWNEATMPQNH